MTPFTYDASTCQELKFSKIIIPSLKKIEAITTEEELLSELLVTIKDNYLFKDHQPRQFLSVASFPQKQVDYLTQRALNRLNLKPSLVLELGTNCASILDAIFIASKISQRDTQTVLLCTDLFGSTLKVNGVEQAWLNGASAVVFGDGDQKLSIKAYATINDPQFIEAVKMKTSGSIRSIDFANNDFFFKNDIPNELAVVESVIAASGLNWSDIDGYIAINRSIHRYQSLKKELPIRDHILFQSKESFGHRGATDLLANLNNCLSTTDKEKLSLILIGNGIGYTWSAMLVEITR